MPIYEYVCPACGSRRTVLRTVDERKDKIPCNVSSCGAKMVFEISAPATPVMDPVKPVRRPHNL